MRAEFTIMTKQQSCSPRLKKAWKVKSKIKSILLIFLEATKNLSHKIIQLIPYSAPKKCKNKSPNFENMGTGWYIMTMHSILLSCSPGHFWQKSWLLSPFTLCTWLNTLTLLYFPENQAERHWKTCWKVTSSRWSKKKHCLYWISSKSFTSRTHLENGRITGSNVYLHRKNAFWGWQQSLGHKKIF